MNKQKELEKKLNRLEEIACCMESQEGIVLDLSRVDYNKIHDECLEILKNYSYSDFEKQINRYLILEGKYR